MTVFVHHREVPGAGFLKLSHDGIHRLLGRDIFLRRFHIIVYAAGVVKIRPEHILPDAGQGYVSLEPALGIQHREKISLALGNQLYQFSQRGIYPHGQKILFQHILGMHQRKHRLV